MVIGRSFVLGTCPYFGQSSLYSRLGVVLVVLTKVLVFAIHIGGLKWMLYLLESSLSNRLLCKNFLKI